MDGYILPESIKNFDSVWGRVSGEVGVIVPLRSEQAVLEERIGAEQRNAAFYDILARRYRGMERTIRRIAAEERGHMRELQVEHFLLTGDTYMPEPSCPVVTSVLEALRTAYKEELAAADIYKKQAAATPSEALREIYECHAADETRHAETLRTMISGLIG